MKILTPIKSIRQKCLDCSCWQPQEVRLCEHTECVLYPYRMGRRPKKVDNSSIKPVVSKKGEIPRGFRAKVAILAGLCFLSLTLLGNPAFAETGIASWYSQSDTLETRNKYTASGEVFDDTAMTCAMSSMEYGKYYKVCNLDNNKCVVVKHNDVGMICTSPESRLVGRVVDLTKSAFQKIADIDKGLIKVEVSLLGDQTANIKKHKGLLPLNMAASCDLLGAL